MQFWLHYKESKLHVKCILKIKIGDCDQLKGNLEFSLILEEPIGNLNGFEETIENCNGF